MVLGPDWWVEHHADGTTSVGWDAGDMGGNYLTGPKLSFGSKEGTYANKSKPSLKGVVKKGPKRSFAAAKARAAAARTATLTSIAGPAVTTASAPIDLSLAETGQCKAVITVHRGATFVSSTGIVPMSFPSKRPVALPAVDGEYTVTLQGRNGCLGQSRSTEVLVNAPLRAVVGPIALRP